MSAARLLRLKNMRGCVQPMIMVLLLVMTPRMAITRGDGVFGPLLALCILLLRVFRLFRGRDIALLRFDI